MDEFKRRSWREQTQRLRQATPDERLRAAAHQREISTELLRAGLRSRFPGLDALAIDDKVGELVFGEKFWRDACERRRRRSHGHPAP